MSDKTIIEQSAEFLASHNNCVSENLTSDASDAEATVYKIAVVGRYQTGKTTLINKVFLRDDFLATGVGLCKTSVITKLTNGPEKRVVLSKNDVDGKVFREEMADPTPAKIEEVTSAGSNEARLALSKELSQVEVSWPCPALKNYEIYDTPGIDDPIEELLDQTTYRIVPTVDLVLLVVEPKDLSEQEVAFLKHKLFKCGLKRAMIIVSYNPAQPLSATARADVVSSIRGRLAGIGREYFPICVCTYDSSVEGEILNTPDAIERRIASFIEENAAAARDEKNRYALSYEIMKVRNELAAKKLINGKSDSEISEIKNQVKTVSEDLDLKYKKIMVDFNADYYKFKEDVNVEAVKAFSHAQGIIIGLVGANQTYADLRAALPQISKRAKTEFENALIEVNTFASNRLQDMLAQRQSDISSASKELVLPTAMDVNLNSGWAGKLNPRIIVVSEYAIMMLLTQGPLGAGIRYATSFIPGLRNLLPSNFVKQFVVKSVTQSLESNYDEIIGLIGDILDETKGYVGKAIAGKFVELHKLTCEPYQKAIEDVASKKLTQEELTKINEEMDLADRLVAGLK